MTNVPIAQTYIFIIFKSISDLFEGVFSLWVSLKDIWIDVNRKYSLFLSDILHVIPWLFLFINKSKKMKRMNEKFNYTLHEYYYLYEVLHPRLESK